MHGWQWAAGQEEPLVLVMIPDQQSPSLSGLWQEASAHKVKEHPWSGVRHENGSLFLEAEYALLDWLIPAPPSSDPLKSAWNPLL